MRQPVSNLISTCCDIMPFPPLLELVTKKSVTRFVEPSWIVTLPFSKSFFSQWLNSSPAGRFRPNTTSFHEIPLLPAAVASLLSLTAGALTNRLSRSSSSPFELGCPSERSCSAIDSRMDIRALVLASSSLSVLRLFTRWMEMDMTATAESACGM